MNKPAFPSKTSEEVKEAHASSPSSGVQRGVEELQSEHEATKAYHKRLIAYMKQENEEEQYNTRLAQFVLHHFDEMNRKAGIDFVKGRDSLDTDCEQMKKSADRAKAEYIAVLALKKEGLFIKHAIRSESSQPVKAKKLQKRLDALNNKIHDRLTKMATEYNFDGKAELVDQAMSIAVRYEVDGAENPGVLNAFFNTCSSEYDPVETRELLAFLQNKYPDA